MKELMFFDANAVIGDTLMGPKPGAAELLRQMDRYGVEKALVRHGNLATTGAINANREMTGWISGAPPERLYGVWCILPDQCEEIPSGKELFQAMRKNRIAALTLMPDEHRYLANQLTIGKIMDEAAERKRSGKRNQDNACQKRARQNHQRFSDFSDQNKEEQVEINTEQQHKDCNNPFSCRILIAGYRIVKNGKAAGTCCGKRSDE